MPRIWPVSRTRRIAKIAVQVRRDYFNIALRYWLVFRQMAYYYIDFQIHSACRSRRSFIDGLAKRRHESLA